LVNKEQQKNYSTQEDIKLQGKKKVRQERKKKERKKERKTERQIEP